MNYILENIFYRAKDNARQCGAPIESAPLVAIQLFAWRKVSEESGNGLYGTYAEALERPHRGLLRPKLQVYWRSTEYFGGLF